MLFFNFTKFTESHAWGLNFVSEEEAQKFLDFCSVCVIVPNICPWEYDILGYICHLFISVSNHLPSNNLVAGKEYSFIY